MNVAQELKEMVASSASRISKESLAIMDSFQKELEKLNPLKAMKKKGDRFPNFTLPNHEGKTISSEELLQKGPLVVTFYRGGWCPYCNVELRGYQKILPQISDKGATLVAISPEVPDKSLDLVQKHGIDFYVLSDIDNKFAKELGLIFQLNTELIDTYKTFGIDLESSQGNAKNELPVPATYVITQNGIISFVAADLDYRVRTDPSEILVYL